MPKIISARTLQAMLQDAFSKSITMFQAKKSYAWNQTNQHTLEIT